MADDIDNNQFNERNPPPPSSADFYGDDGGTSADEYPEIPENAGLKKSAPVDASGEQKIVKFEKIKKKRANSPQGERTLWMRVIYDVLEAYPDLKIIQDDGDKKPAGYRNWDEKLKCWIPYTSTDIFDIVSDFGLAVVQSEKHDTLVSRATKFLDVELRRGSRKTSHEEWGHLHGEHSIGQEWRGLFANGFYHH